MAFAHAKGRAYASTTLYARLIGAFPFYDPTLLRIYRYGTFTAVLGLALAILSRAESALGRWAYLASCCYCGYSRQ
jgi:hypothetical protein